MYTKDDFAAIFNIVCAVLGVGSLGMAHAWAKSGPVFGSISLSIMCLFNAYSAICLSRCLLGAPSHVKTYSDLGSHVMGSFGRYLVIFSQFSFCLMISVAFLILGGGTLLPAIFGASLDANIWIILMAIFLLPIVLIRNLKEAAWAALLGSAGAFFCVVIAVVFSMKDVPFRFIPSKIEVDNVLSVFGVNALAFGGAVVIPAIQRDHPSPKKVPSLMAWSLVVICLLYATIAILGYIQFGCTAPQNLLYSMSKGEAKRISYIMMQIHICVALAVMMNPVLYVLERNLIGDKLFSEKLDEGFERKCTSLSLVDKSSDYLDVDKCRLRASQHSIPEKPYTRKQKIQSFIIRTTSLAVLVFVAMLLQGSFDDMASFVGATAITLSCMVVPCLLYFKMFSKTLPTWEKVLCLSVIVISCLCGAFSAYKAVKNIVTTSSQLKLFQAAVKPKDVNKFMYCVAQPSQ